MSFPKFVNSISALVSRGFSWLFSSSKFLQIRNGSFTIGGGSECCASEKGKNFTTLSNVLQFLPSKAWAIFIHIQKKMRDFSKEESVKQKTLPNVSNVRILTNSNLCDSWSTQWDSKIKSGKNTSFFFNSQYNFGKSYSFFTTIVWGMFFALLCHSTLLLSISLTSTKRLYLI